jgi:hypothetical protein
LSAIGGNVTEQKAGDWYFWLVTRTKGGFTLFSDVASISVAANGGVRASIASAARTDSSNVEEVYLVGNTSNSPLSASILAYWPGYNPVTRELEVLPAALDLNRDAHFELGATVATGEDLPAGSDLLLGMLRNVDADALIYQYRVYADSGTAVNGWLPFFPQDFNPYVASTTDDLYGCDRPVDAVSDAVALSVNYSGSGTSEPVGFILYNDSRAIVPAGRRLGISCEYMGRNISSALAGRASVVVLGYTEFNTHSLDADVASAGVELTYEGEESVYSLSKDLPDGWGILFEIRLKLEPYLYDPSVGFVQGALVKFYAEILARNAVYSPNEATGNYINDRYIVPDGPNLQPIAVAGSGRVGDYGFKNIGPQAVPGLAANTADQLIAITNNGICYRAISLADNLALRAIASTVDADGKAYDAAGNEGGWTAVSVNSSTSIQVTIAHPSAVRDDYPDLQIAGKAAVLNASFAIVRVRPAGGGQVVERAFGITGSPEQPDVLLVGANLGTDVADPAAVADEVGLFAPLSIGIEAVAGASVFATGSVEVQVCYRYEGTLTSITHDEQAGCIFNLGGQTVASAIASAKYWRTALPDAAAARALDAAEFSDPHYRRIGSFLYEYDPTNTDAIDDGNNFIVPTSGTGAYSKFQSPGGEGGLDFATLPEIDATDPATGKLVVYDAALEGARAIGIDNLGVTKEYRDELDISNSTLIYLPFNGENNSTEFTDLGSAPGTWTPVLAQYAFLTTGESVEGGSSLSLETALLANWRSEWNLGSDLFTFVFQFKITSPSVDIEVFRYNAGGFDTPFVLYGYDWGVGDVYTVDLSIYPVNDNLNGWAFVPYSALSDFVHVAVVRTPEDDYRMYLNGSLALTLSPYSPNESLEPGQVTSIRVGMPSWRTPDGQKLYLENIALVKGECLFTGNFTPPSLPPSVAQVSGLVDRALDNNARLLLKINNIAIGLRRALNIVVQNAAIAATDNDSLEQIDIILSGESPATLVTGVSQVAAVGGKYVADNTSRVIFSLSPFEFGEGFEVFGKGTGGWRIIQAGGQRIIWNGSATTLGAGGYVESAAPTLQYATARLICIEANTLFQLISNSTLTVI